MSRDFKGSRPSYLGTQLALRDHDDLTNIRPADPASSDATRNKHTSNAEAQKLAGFGTPGPVDAASELLVTGRVGGFSIASSVVDVTDSFSGTSEYMHADLTGAAEIRLVSRNSANAGASSLVYAQYSLDEGSNWVDLTGASRSLATTGRVDSTWLSIPTAAKTWVALRMVTSGGNGSTSTTMFAALYVRNPAYSSGATAVPATGLLNTVEVSLGSVPRMSGHFDITTTGLNVGQNAIIEQMVGPYTGKGTRADEAEMDQITVTGQAISSTVIRCYWTSPTHVRGNFKFAYTLVSTLNTVPEATTTTSGLLKSAFQETHIEGLSLVWGSPGTNGTNLTVTSGSAWIPSLSAIMDVPSDLTGPSMTFAASTWYYVYLTSSGTLEISTTAPAAPYKGTARSKTGDTSRRFIGAIRTDASNAVWNFDHIDNWIMYRVGVFQAPFWVLNSAGITTSELTVSAASCVPIGTKMVSGVGTGSGGVNIHIGNSADSITSVSTSPYGYSVFGAKDQYVSIFFAVDSSQAFIVAAQTSGNLYTYININGYLLER